MVAVKLEISHKLTWAHNAYLDQVALKGAAWSESFTQSFRQTISDTSWGSQADLRHCNFLPYL